MSCQEFSRGLRCFAESSLLQHRSGLVQQAGVAPAFIEFQAVPEKKSAKYNGNCQSSSDKSDTSWPELSLEQGFQTEERLADSSISSLFSSFCDFHIASGWRCDPLVLIFTPRACCRGLERVAI